MRFGDGYRCRVTPPALMCRSIPKVIYAIATNTSIGALFVYGLSPALNVSDDPKLCVVTGSWPGAANYPRVVDERPAQACASFAPEHSGIDAAFISSRHPQRPFFTRPKQSDGRRYAHRSPLCIQDMN